MLPLPLEAGAYDYRIPPEMSLSLGAFVVVPLNQREMIGVVWDGAPDPDLPASRLKSVVQALDVPPMTPSLRRFVEWVAACDVLCQPSLVEPFGVALLEAMAGERSVVATSVGGPPEFVPPEAGVLVDPIG